MNAESFVQYVQQLSKLYQLPYEELKSLSMQYPYFQNLHLLLALKSKLEDHPDYPRNLAKASTYSVDRAQLYRTLTKLEKLALEDNFLIHEEVLELQEITRLEEKLKDLELIPDATEDLPLSNQLVDSIPSTTSPIIPQEIEKEDFPAPEVKPTPVIDQAEVLPKASAAEAGENQEATVFDNGLIEDALALSFLLEDFHQKPPEQIDKTETVTSNSIATTSTPLAFTLEEDLVANLVAASKLLEKLPPTIEERTKSLAESILFTEQSTTVIAPKAENTLLLDTVAVAAVLDYFHSKTKTPGPSIPQAAPEPTKKAPTLPTSELNLELKTKQLKKQLKKIKRKNPKPMPKKSFSTWIEQFQSAHIKPHLGDLMEAKKKEKLTLISSKSDPAKLQGDNLNFFAQKSILENKQMASETLAEILVAQMQYQKAIKVYERLSLIFPEKSAFFAGKIENLKKLTS